MLHQIIYKSKHKLVVAVNGLQKRGFFYANVADRAALWFNVTSAWRPYVGADRTQGSRRIRTDLDLFGRMRTLGTGSGSNSGSEKYLYSFFVLRSIVNTYKYMYVKGRIKPV
jgi:hypothetical protein